jgi:hypothetical protein
MSSWPRFGLSLAIQAPASRDCALTSSASSGLHTETEAHYSPSHARRRHCPGVIPIPSVNTRRNAAT